MTDYERVLTWLDDMQNKIDQEPDEKYRQELWRNRRDIEINLGRIANHLNKGTTHHFCVDCGKIEIGTTKPQLAKSMLCFHCDFWKQREQHHLKNPLLIVDGRTYSDGGNKPSSRSDFLGHAGRTFHISMLDGSKEWSTNNLWCGGDIPKKYRETTMKDNAEFVEEPLQPPTNLLRLLHI